MEVLQTQDVMIKQIPEVQDVLGKIGRIESALDPAPAAMVETYVMLKPRDQWRPGMTERKIWDEINAVGHGARHHAGVAAAAHRRPRRHAASRHQGASMAVRIYGDSLDGLAQAALSPWRNSSRSTITSTPARSTPTS
jgi:copper/silver efflux system protein